eukprot:s614_g6.t1
MEDKSTDRGYKPRNALGGLSRFVPPIGTWTRFLWADTWHPREEDIIYNDLMWSDPFEGDGIRGSQRGGSARQFGADITEQFLAKNDLSFMIRSHEDEGYEWMHNKKCLTVFSAPGYCDACNNRGAVVRLHADEADEGRLRPEIRPFDTAEKPQDRPTAGGFDYVYAMSYASSTYQLWTEALRKAGIER